MLTGRDRTLNLAEAVGQHGTDDKNAACNGHRSDGFAADNGKKIAEHAAGGDLIKEKAYNTD